jgi:hypothetical protein
LFGADFFLFTRFPGKLVGRFTPHIFNVCKTKISRAQGANNIRSG